MRPARGDWSAFRLGCWNIGPAKRLPEAAEGLDALGLNEAADQYGHGKMIDQARAAGYRIITGSKPGQPATPLAWNPLTLRRIKVKRYLLAERQYVGPGAGPDVMRTKWAIGGKFEHLATGRRFWIFAVHYVATQGKPRRRRVAIHMTNRLRLLDKRLRRAVWAVGDFNAKPSSPTVGGLRRAGWRINHAAGRILRTHRRRTIDYIAWVPRPWIQFLSHESHETGSDHNLVVADFAIKPKRRKNR